MQSRSSLALTTGLALGALLLASSPASAQGPSLGAARDFAVLGASTVTNAGLTTIDGDLGVSPGTAITGFPPGVVTGTIHAGDALALQAQSDLTLAYDALAGAACDVVLTGMDLGGLTLTPGVYCFSASAPLNGVVTLDGQGNPDAVFVFQIGSTLLAALGSSVQLVNGVEPDNVFWQVGSSATLSSDVAFKGNLIALASITLSAGSSLDGRALARTGAVTMDTSNVSVPAGNTCTPASVEPIARGCGIPAPVLSCSVPVLGQIATATLDGTVPAVFGRLRLSPYGMPMGMLDGCHLFVNSNSLWIAQFSTDGNGDFTHSQIVPADPLLCGTRLILQGVLFTPSGGRSLTATNALLLTLGT
jgi:type VI secretion system secreted protein VgrG